MNYCTIKTCDIANGEGVRTSLFVSGCTNHCEECFQPQTWDFEYGELFTKEVADKIIESIKPFYVNGPTLLGGEPFEPKNQKELVPFLRRVREECPDKNIWCFTGFTLDKELWVDGSYPRCEHTDEMLSMIDVLVDGRYDDSEKCPLPLKRNSSPSQKSGRSHFFDAKTRLHDECRRVFAVRIRRLLLRSSAAQCVFCIRRN